MIVKLRTFERLEQLKDLEKKLIRFLALKLDVIKRDR